MTVGECRVLSPDDGYYFDSRSPHRFRSASDEPSQIVSAVTPPTY
ncbi:cupin domain-containing protein [Mesorhizobium sp. 1B3]